MWTLLAGLFMSIFFYFSTLNFYKNNFSNKNCSLSGKIVCWFFQEHVNILHNMTVGKRFMLKKDFRNRFITQSIQIIRNIISLVYFRNIFELGTLICLFLYFSYVIFLVVDSNKKFLGSVISFEYLVNYVRSELTINFRFLVFLAFLKYSVLSVYSFFDFVFVFKPFVFIFYSLFFLIAFLWFIYLFFVFITVKCSLVFSFRLKMLIQKIEFYFFFFLVFFEVLLREFNFENSFTENIFKEMLVKLCLFFV